MKLKTLKDLPRFAKNEEAEKFGLIKDPTTELIYIPDLKAEAVKWVKSFINQNSVFTIHAEKAFIKFFNLTEEDLK